ncbi:MAG: alkaline phosphatase family protein [Tannerella sp.]|jgi:hypothetical protein|nr:alkaline phosphatase family protein [Tannerella sp.]
MKKLIASFITVLVAANMYAQEKRTPQLVVIITIDQLRGDYVEFFKSTFGEKGFKRLLNEGITYSHVRFEFSNTDRASSFATLFTGSNPCYHSITGNMKYDFEKEREISSLHDSHYLGNYTHQNLSPKNLLCSTVGDELRYASKGTSHVFSISPELESAIISAGHAGNGAFWIDDFNGKWATTTYYRNIPPYVDKLNIGKESLSQRLPSITWSMMLPSDRYSALPYINDNKSYHYTFNEKEVDCYQRFKTSAYVNNEVGRLALEFINNGNIGAHQTPDMLCITFYGGNFADVRDKSHTREVQDIYFRLDKNIEELLEAVDRKIGLSNALIVVSGNGYYINTETIAEGDNAPGGAFHPQRCTALLNMYLMAIYGQKNWVKGYYNKQIYLNRKTIEDERIELSVIQDKSSEFIAEFSGVHKVTTDHKLRNGEWNEGSATLHYGTYHAGRGDLIIELQPGWGVQDEITGVTMNVKNNNAVQTPLVFFGYGLKPVKIERSVYATEIAPTITNILRIRSPNACSDLPLPEVIRNQ